MSSSTDVTMFVADDIGEAAAAPVRHRKLSFESYKVDPNIPDPVPAADKRSVGEADGGGVSNTGDTDAAEMTDVDTVSTVASSSTTKKRACGRKDDDDDAKMEDPATRPVKRQRRVHFDPVVSVGLAPTGVDRPRTHRGRPDSHPEAHTRHARGALGLCVCSAEGADVANRGRGGPASARHCVTGNQ